MERRPDPAWRLCQEKSRKASWRRQCLNRVWYLYSNTLQCFWRSIHATHTHTNIPACNYPIWIQQSDPPHLFTNRALITIGKNGWVGFQEPQPTYFMGQPIYLMVFHLRFQKIWKQKAASHKCPGENRGQAHTCPRPHPHLESQGPCCEPGHSFFCSHFLITGLLRPSFSFFHPHNNCFHREHLVLLENTSLKLKNTKFSIAFLGVLTQKGPCPASTHLKHSFSFSFSKG